jgi:hypothetical protein
MTNELDLVGMFEGMPPEQVKELTARIRSAVLNEYRNFRQETGTEPAKIRAPLPRGVSKANMSKGHYGKV